MPEGIALSQLSIYPVKSCVGNNIDKSLVNHLGLAYDRYFMLVDKSGQMLTQRQTRGLHLLNASIDADDLLLQSSGLDDLRVSLRIDGPAREVDCWHDRCRAVDCGDQAATALSAVLGQEVRLLRLDEQERRIVEDDDAITSFTDGFPMLLIGTASLRDLNSRLQEHVPMQRFRPNLVVDTSEPFEEDHWKRIRIGEIEFDVVKPCKRCVFTCIDQSSGVKGVEPLKTLSKYRRFDNEVHFGMNVIHRGQGQIAVGQKVEVLA